MPLALVLCAASPSSSALRSEDLVLYVQGSRAGELSSVDQPRSDGGFRMTRRATLELKRGAEVLQLSSRSTCEVDPALTPLSFTYERSDASGTMTHQARFTCRKGGGCRMALTTSVGGVQQQDQQELASGVTCMSALEVLARRNLKDGFTHQGLAVAEELGVAPQQVRRPDLQGGRGTFD